MATARSSTSLTPANRPSRPDHWHELLTTDGLARPHYHPLLEHFGRLKPAELRLLEDRMAATLREMGVTFDVIRSDPWGRQPWACDLLPQVFTSQEWEFLVRGFRQRLRAFELFLADVYGPRHILRSGTLPAPLVLGSPHYQPAAIGLPRPRDAYLHLSGLCLTRDSHGRFLVRQQHFAHASGISPMLQNRRALARIVPEIFQEMPVQPLADTSLLMLEQLREAAASFEGEPMVVLLSQGTNSALSSEQSFLARRMGIPTVEGGDLLVLDSCVYIKTVRGLKRVEVISNSIPDSLLDPLVFGGNPAHGVAGLVHCLRKGTVALVNALGSQVADDQTLLAFSNKIITFYLNESPLLPSIPTLWLGDIDQREHVLDHLDQFRLTSVVPSLHTQARDSEPSAALLAEVRKQPHFFIAQPRDDGAHTLCFHKGRKRESPQDHVLFALRTGADFDLLPGALTRVYSTPHSDPAEGLGWISKDTWVLESPSTDNLLHSLSPRITDAPLPSRQVTSRVADAFYWMGRYLERAHHQAHLISVVETLETEELNSAERKLYRPVWNRLLPPIEKSAGTSRRSIAGQIDRYRLLLLPEPGSVQHAILSACSNAHSVQDSLSPEALATLNDLRSRFHRKRFRQNLSEPEAASVTRRLAEQVTKLIPQFFATAANTMLADDGWRFCELGQMLERSIITANSLLSISASVSGQVQRSSPHGSEIELSAFLRLLGCRDAYRRIFQMRAEPVHVFQMLWQHEEVPRSVLHCLERCSVLLHKSMAADPTSPTQAPAALHSLLQQIRTIDWRPYVLLPSDDEPATHKPLPTPATSTQRKTTTPTAAQSPSTQAPAHIPSLDHRPTEDLEPLLKQLLDSALELHTLISDSFLNHQARIAQVSQPAPANA